MMPVPDAWLQPRCFTEWVREYLVKHHIDHKHLLDHYVRPLGPSVRTGGCNGFRQELEINEIDKRQAIGVAQSCYKLVWPIHRRAFMAESRSFFLLA